METVYVNNMDVNDPVKYLGLDIYDHYEVFDKNKVYNHIKYDYGYGEKEYYWKKYIFGEKEYVVVCRKAIETSCNNCSIIKKSYFSLFYENVLVYGMKTALGKISACDCCSEYLKSWIPFCLKYQLKEIGKKF